VNAPHPIIALAAVLGIVAMWLMLPRGTRRGQWIGAVIGAVALGLGTSQLPWVGSWGFGAAYYAVAVVTIVAAVATVTFRNPVYCALWFGLTLTGTSGLMLLVGAEFLAIATIVVYAGAILVTFLFVLMLAQPEGRAAYDRASSEALLSAAAGVLIVGVLTTTLTGVLSAPSGEAAMHPALQAADAEQLAVGVLAEDHVARFGAELFGRHLIAVEVTGTLLFAALVGAAVIVAVNQRPE